MKGAFYTRLRAYYVKVGAVLRGEADTASIFPNSTDKGMSRERVYAEFLRQHAPSKCNVFFGGFLFGEDGSESGQLDVLVTTDTTPQFNFHNRDGQGKAFSPVEGTLGVASIKSNLDKKELEDALTGLAAIPQTISLQGRINPFLSVKDYDDWPYKIVYASSGISGEAIFAHLNEYYTNRATIPIGRRPNVIHVSGQYSIFRVTDNMTLSSIDRQDAPPTVGQFVLSARDPDLQAILWVLDALQRRATASAHILYSYSNIINRVQGLSPTGSRS
jgi:hypothetical protein